MRRFVEQLEPRTLRTALAQLGDASGDGRIDSADFVILSQHFSQVTSSGPAAGDFNGDHRVNALDFNILATNFGAVVATKTWNGLGDQDLNSGSNWVGGVVPGPTDIASIPLNLGAPPPQQNLDSGGLTALGGLILDDAGQGDGFSFMNGIRVNGDVQLNHIDGSLVSLASVNGTVTGTIDGNGGLEVDDQQAADVLTIGATTGQLQIVVAGNRVGATVVSTVTRDLSFASNPFVGGVLQANTGVDIFCNGASFDSSVVFQGPGTISGFSIDVPNTYATQQAGTKHVGDTVSGTYSLAHGFAPDNIPIGGGNNVGDFPDSNFHFGGGTYSFKILQAMIDNGAFFPSGISLNDSINGITLYIGSFEVVAGGGGATAAMTSHHATHVI